MSIARQAQRDAHRQIADAANQRTYTLAWDTPAADVDVVTDTPSDLEESTEPITIFARPPGPKDGDMFGVGTAVLQRSRLFLLSAYGLVAVPEPGYRVKDWEGGTWTVRGIAPFAPDGATVLFYKGVMDR